MALSSDPNLDLDYPLTAGVELSGALPYDIEFIPPNLPQPTDAAWANRIYAYIYWGNDEFVNDPGEIATASLDIIKHDRDVLV